MNLAGLERSSKTPMVIMTELARGPLDNGVRALSATDFLVKRNQFFLPFGFRKPQVAGSIRVASSKKEN